jgi:4-amino-4-deoxy-L-arabinose transferase-like glycosyltransferase
MTRLPSKTELRNEPTKLKRSWFLDRVRGVTRLMDSQVRGAGSAKRRARGRNHKPASVCRRSAVGVDLLTLAALWFASVLIVNPLGNFPLNDDWSFGAAVKHLIEDGEYRPGGWTSMSLISHVFWGALFCLPSGFSFNALRLSTLTLSLLGVLGTYLLVTDLRGSRWLALITALTLAFNPIYFALSATFMTDAPFASLTVLALLFFTRHLKTGSGLDWTAATLLAIAACLCRQIGVVLPLAFGASLLCQRGIATRHLLRAFVPLLLCIGALLVLYWRLQTTGRAPELSHSGEKGLVQSLTDLKELLRVPVKSLKTLIYLGWFLSPVMILAWPNVLAPKNKRVRFGVAAGLVSIVFVGTLVLFVLDRLMPFESNFGFGNIIIESGIGPLTLADVAITRTTELPSVKTVFWLLVTALSLLGSILLIVGVGASAVRLVTAIRAGQMKPNRVVVTFPLLAAAFYLLPFLFLGGFDRYFVPVIPLLAAIAVASRQFPRLYPRGRILAAAAALAMFVIFSVCGTRDYLAWNRVRWRALSHLLNSDRAQPRDVDGGFEFNGWYSYDPEYQGTGGKSWWWVDQDIYLVSFRPVPGYRALRQYSYANWMPPHTASIFVLEKELRPTMANKAESDN